MNTLKKVGMAAGLIVAFYLVYMDITIQNMVVKSVAPNYYAKYFQGD